MNQRDPARHIATHIAQRVQRIATAVGMRGELEHFLCNAVDLRIAAQAKQTSLEEEDGEAA